MERNNATQQYLDPMAISAFLLFFSIIQEIWDDSEEMMLLLHAANLVLLAGTHTDDIAMRNIMQLYIEDHGRHMVPRSFHPRQSFQWYLHSGHESLFRGLFRVTRSEFGFLCNHIQTNSDLYPVYFQAYPNAVTVFEGVGMVLFWLGNSCSMRGLCGVFGYWPSTVQRHIHRLLSFLVAYIANVCQMPSTEQGLSAMAQFFQNLCHIPSIIGAVDGTHFPILAPLELHAQYLNRKGFHSLVFQGIVSPARIFLDLYGGWAGAISDKSLWQMSSIRNRFADGEFHNFSLLGDAIYPEDESWFMLPYDIMNTPYKVNYNYWQSRGRIPVECAFGILKSRFRILKAPFTSDPEVLVNVVVVCVVLHNILQCVHQSEDAAETMEILGDALDFSCFESGLEVDEDDAEVVLPNQFAAWRRNQIARSLPPRPAIPV